MNQALYAHMNNKRKMEKKKSMSAESSTLHPGSLTSAYFQFTCETKIVIEHLWGAQAP
jgi:hypothetical protein